MVLGARRVRFFSDSARVVSGARCIFCRWSGWFQGQGAFFAGGQGGYRAKVQFVPLVRELSGPAVSWASRGHSLDKSVVYRTITSSATSGSWPCLITSSFLRSPVYHKSLPSKCSIYAAR
jgi:hypothetical protein